MPLRHAVSYPLYLRTVVLAMSLLGCEPAPRPDAGAPDPKADRAAILAHPAIAKFVQWVADKPPDFHAPTRRAR